MTIISSARSRLAQLLGAAPQPGAPAGAAGAQLAKPGIVGPPGSNPVHVRLLAFNDLHGQLGDLDAKIGNDAVGGAATLAAYINRERAQNPEGTVLLSVGDAFGASPPESTLLHHESTMAVMAAMGVNVATVGNHEFDKGYDETIRLIAGGARDARRGAAAVGTGGTGAVGGAAGAAGAGATPGGVAAAGAGAAAAQQQPVWPGSPFPWVSANVVDKKTGKPVLPPYVIKEVNGVKIAFIGAVTKNLKNVTDATGITNIKALDPAEAINQYIPEIQAQGVKTIVAFVHEGAEVDDDEADEVELEGPLVDIAKRLDPEVDVVMSAHSHEEYATTVNGKIVTQALSYGRALAAVDLAIDPKTGDVVAGSSRIVKNLEKGITPDPLVAQMVDMFQQAIAPKTKRVVSVLPGAVTRERSKAGESALGTLIAEAQRQYAGADIAFMNPGGIRQDIVKGGKVTWGDLFGVQPFGNKVTKLEMTGAQVMAVLEQMFTVQAGPTILQIAGMRVTYDMTKPKGQRIVSVVMDDGTKLDPRKKYTVAGNDFLIKGGDGFTAFSKGKVIRQMGDDLDALVAYLEAGKPVPLKPIGRLKIAGGELPHDAH